MPSQASSIVCASLSTAFFFWESGTGTSLVPCSVRTVITCFSAIRFNSHRIHYDRDYVTQVEKLPGLVVQSSLISQLLMEMCRRELPAKRLTNFDFQNLRSVYDSDGKFTLYGNPSADGREATLWAVDGKGNPAMLVTAKFA